MRLRAIAFTSLFLNLVFTVASSIWIAKKGGPRYLGEQLGIIRTVHRPDDWQVDWRARNEGLPNTEGEIVFLGDSITASMPWAEFYSPIRNRGIGGDTADGVLQRLTEITESQPKQVFLNIGTNDLATETPTHQVIDDIASIVKSIHRDSPKSRIYVCSILPINLDIADDVRKSKKQRFIPYVNGALRDLSEELDFTFVDLTDDFQNAAGNLRPEFTADGLHLNPAGQMLYCRRLAALVETDTARYVASAVPQD